MVNSDLLHELIADIRNRSLSARYVFKQLRDKRIDKFQSIMDLEKEFDKIDKILVDCELNIEGGSTYDTR